MHVRIIYNCAWVCGQIKKISLVMKVLIKPDEAGSLYNEDTWINVVKKKLHKQLPNIPVSKATLTKNSQNYLFFSDQKSHDIVVNNLKSAFAVETKDNSLKLLLSKIKGLETDSYANNSNGLLQLKQTILTKIEAIQSLVEN